MLHLYGFSLVCVDSVVANKNKFPAERLSKEWENLNVIKITCPTKTIRTISYDGDRATFSFLLPRCSAGRSKASIQCESFDDILNCPAVWIAASEERKDDNTIICLRCWSKIYKLCLLCGRRCTRMAISLCKSSCAHKGYHFPSKPDDKLCD